MRRTTVTASIWCALLCALPARADAQTPGGGTIAPASAVRMTATTIAEARRQGPFKSGGLSWSCKGTFCSGSARLSAAPAACQSLARDIGPLRSFSAANRSFPADDLQRCNGSGAAPNDAVVRTNAGRAVTSKDFAPLARPLPESPTRVRATPSTPPKDTPAATPAPGPFVPIAVRAPPMTLTGTGMLDTVATFRTVVVRTAPMTLTGTGALETVVPFTPVTVRTAPMTLTGTGRIE